MIVNELTRIALENKQLYKVILDCSEGNMGFYEKLGYKKKEV